MTALLARMCEGDGRDVRSAIVDAICGFVARHAEFLRLGSLMNGVLKQNLTDEFIEGYNPRLGEALIATTSAPTSAST